ncbi:hypothetical protein [uncultured Demequina sp.]|uniref:hypothetical protein n=1 Tax=uncultured Demequina sp. TaxID=693499 RepID=UPI0025E1D3BC|nr:hypothetical protein [uncultured Demequina sp.]
MRLATWGRAGRWALGLALGVVVVASGPAQADDPPISISADGATYSAQYPGGLFDGAVIVPNTAPERSFWVRNTGPSGAHLAVAIRDVNSASADLLDALSVEAHAGGVSGPRVGLWAVSPCVTLLSAVHLDQGEAARVDVALAMADVDGDTAQVTDADFSLVLTLTSDDVPAPGGCSMQAPTPDTTDGPSVPGSGTPAAPPASVPGGTGTGVVAPPAVVIPGFTGPSEPATIPSAPPVVDGPTDVEDVSEVAGATGVDPNTDRFYQEYFVLAWVVEAILAGTVTWWVVRRRQRAEVMS